jgi:hypothetical protein
MSNIKSERTGLPNFICIWISSSEGAQHGPRIKVSNVRGKSAGMQNSFSVTVSNNPEIIAGSPDNFSSKELVAVNEWVVLNQVVLITFWKNPFGWDSIDVIAKLKKLPK